MAVGSMLMMGALFVACGDKDGAADTAAENRAPVANAGADVNSTGLSRVALVGTGSYDDDGDPITYHWSFDRVPNGSALKGNSAVFANNDSAAGSGTTFVPDAIGVYVVQLVVKDDKGAASRPDYVVVDVSGGTAPVAVAGADQTGSIGGTVTLDGSGSYDPLGLSLSYAWSFASTPSGSAVTLNNPTTATPDFRPDVGGVYVLALTVNNGFLSSSADSALVYVSSGEPASPVAVSQGDIDDAQDCMDLTLDGSGSYDPNGDTLAYNWTLQSKPSGSATDNYSFADRRAAKTTFFPDVSGTYTFSLAVSDGTTWSSPDVFTAVVKERFANTPPRVDAGTLVEVAGGTALCTTDSYGRWECGSCAATSATIGSTAVVEDAEDSNLSLMWTAQDSGATFTGSQTSLVTTVSLRGATAVEPDVCTPNFFRFDLTATDCPQETGTDEAIVIVQCCGELYSGD